MTRRGLAAVPRDEPVIGPRDGVGQTPTASKRVVESPYLDTDGAVQYLQVKGGRSALYKLMHHHACPFLRMGGRLRFDKRDLDRWLRDQSAKIELATRR